MSNSKLEERVEKLERELTEAHEHMFRLRTALNGVVHTHEKFISEQRPDSQTRSILNDLRRLDLQIIRLGQRVGFDWEEPVAHGADWVKRKKRSGWARFWGMG